MLLVDRRYDVDWIRAFASDQGAWANIPPKRNRKEAICFSPYLYRARNLVERFFNKIKQCRRIATRYDKLAANYLALQQAPPRFQEGILADLDSIDEREEAERLRSVWARKRVAKP
jgi:transposase